PTEAQWEYAASAAARLYETRYAWGDDPPTCDRAVYARTDLTVSSAGSCYQKNDPTTFGPLPVTAREGPTGDVTPGTRIVGMAGNLSEWTLDAFAPYTSPCWSSTSIESRVCSDPDAPLRTIRGGAWYSDPALLLAAFRDRVPAGTPDLYLLGFRCVY